MSEGTLAKPKQGVTKHQEVSGNTGQVGGTGEALKGGVYRHPQSGEEIIALSDPIVGDAQARGFVRAGVGYPFCPNPQAGIWAAPVLPHWRPASQCRQKQPRSNLQQ